MRSLLFIDDHPVYRDGLSRLLQAAMPDLAVHVADGEKEALRMLRGRIEVDLALSDYRLGEGDGLALIAAIRRERPLVATGLLCADPSPLLSARAQAAGAVACLSKDRDGRAMADAVEQLFAGQTVFDVQPAGTTADLSLRRREIVALAAEGMLDKQIGERLGISESTVRDHWQHMFDRLGVANRTEAVVQAIRKGLI